MIDLSRARVCFGECARARKRKLRNSHIYKMMAPIAHEDNGTQSYVMSRARVPRHDRCALATYLQVFVLRKSFFARSICQRALTFDRFVRARFNGPQLRDVIVLAFVWVGVFLRSFPRSNSSNPHNERAIQFGREQKNDEPTNTLAR